MTSIMQIALQILLLITAPIWITAIGVTTSCCAWLIYYMMKGQKLNTSKSKTQNISIMKRIFILFPQRIIQDAINRDPDEFREYGLHLFCGEQGSGKTTAVVELLQKLKERYPNCKIRTNMEYTEQDGSLDHWKNLVKNENGIYGQVEVIDEIQAWFSSLESKDFPVEMLTEISQQRKQRKMLIGTAQVFSRVAKPIREQTTFVYLPLTIAGALTWVRKTKPQYWNDEKLRFTRYLGHYFFVHTDKIRNAFDTYQKIEKYKKEGFKPTAEHLRVLDK